MIYAAFLQPNCPGRTAARRRRSADVTDDVTDDDANDDAEDWKINARNEFLARVGRQKRDEFSGEAVNNWIVTEPDPPS